MTGKESLYREVKGIDAADLRRARRLRGLEAEVALLRAVLARTLREGEPEEQWKVLQAAVGVLTRAVVAQMRLSGSSPDETLRRAREMLSNLTPIVAAEAHEQGEMDAGGEAAAADEDGDRVDEADAGGQAAEDEDGELD